MRLFRISSGILKIFRNVRNGSAVVGKWEILSVPKGNFSYWWKSIGITIIMKRICSFAIAVLPCIAIESSVFPS